MLGAKASLKGVKGAPLAPGAKIKAGSKRGGAPIGRQRLRHPGYGGAILRQPLGPRELERSLPQAIALPAFLLAVRKSINP
jgi:hypothetical protein